MALLENLVDRNQGLERLDFIGKDRLSVCVVSFPSECGIASERAPYTLIPDQKAWDDLWSQVYTMHARTCLRLGEISSLLVAFLMLMASSWSVLFEAAS